MNKLAILDFKRKKKSWRLLMSVMVLAYAIIPIISIFFASQDRTEEVRREFTYGSWHVALIGADEETIDNLKNHATVESAGISRTYGMVLDSNNKDLAKIGTVDQNTIQMENINLMKGHLPKNDGEMAIEMSSLTYLGYSDSIGQVISVPVQVNSGKDSKIVELSYTVVGIVQDYSTKLKGTTPDKRDYVSFFVSDKDEVKQYQSVGNFVCRLKKEFLKTDKELLQVKGKYASLLTNNYTYFELGKESSYQLKVIGAHRIAILSSGVLVMSLVASVSYINYKKDQHNNSSLLFHIGKDIDSINRFMIKEVFTINCIALFVGSFGGIIAIITIVGLFKLFTNNIIVITFPIKTILLWELITVFGLTISNFICMSVKHSVVYKKKRVYKRSYLKSKLKNKNINRSIKKVIFKGFELKLLYYFFVFFILFFSIYKTSEERTNWEKFDNIKVPDYKWGLLYNSYPLEMSLENDVYKQIEKVYGVKHIEAYKSNNYLPVNWEGMEESEYVDKLKENFWPKNANSTIPQVFVLGIDPKSEVYDRYADCIQKGTIDEEKFASGEMVILYVPSFNIGSNGYIKFEQNGKYKEDAIIAGTDLEIEGGQGTVEVEVGGITNSFENGENLNDLPRPLLIVGSYALCDKLELDGNHTTLEYFLISTSENINYHQSTLEMYNISEASNRFITDNLENKQMYKNNYFQSLYLYILIDILCILILFIIGFNKVSFSKIEDRKLRTLRYLGLNKSRYYYFKLRTVIIAIGFGSITGAIATILFQSFIFSSKINFDSNLGLNLKMKLAVKIVVAGIPQVKWGSILVVYIVITCIITSIIARKNLKKLEM